MPKPASKPVIAVDIDGVLGKFAESFVRFSNKKWGTRLTPEDYTEHWAEIWKVDYDEEFKRSQIVIRSKIFKTMEHSRDALGALKKLSKHYKLVIVTSRQRFISEDTSYWINKHFGDLFSEIHFAGIWDELEKHTLDKLKLTKAEVCKQIGADYLIDDHPPHCIAAAEAGIKAVLFGDYKWNRDTELINNMVRAKNWREVLEYFDGLGE